LVIIVLSNFRLDYNLRKSQLLNRIRTKVDFDSLVGYIIRFIIKGPLSGLKHNSKCRMCISIRERVIYSLNMSLPATHVV